MVQKNNQTYIYIYIYIDFLKKIVWIYHSDSLRVFPIKNKTLKKIGLKPRCFSGIRPAPATLTINLVNIENIRFMILLYDKFDDIPSIALTSESIISWRSKDLSIIHKYVNGVNPKIVN